MDWLSELPNWVKILGGIFTFLLLPLGVIKIIIEIRKSLESKPDPDTKSPTPQLQRSELLNCQPSERTLTGSIEVERDPDEEELERIRIGVIEHGANFHIPVFTEIKQNLAVVSWASHLKEILAKTDDRSFDWVRPELEQFVGSYDGKELRELPKAVASAQSIFERALKQFDQKDGKRKR